MTNTNNAGISIIGLGPMGRAMADVYLDKGFQVTVWNRTASKADDLVSRGAVRAETISDLLRSNKIVLISLTEYENMYHILRNHTGELNRSVLVNLSSDTPQKAREAERWAQSYGADFLSGGIMADPPLIGQPDAFILYSGNREVFDAHRFLLDPLARADYLGSDPGLSQLFYQAFLDILFTCAAAVLHSAAMFRSANVPAPVYEKYVKDFLGTMPYYFDEMIEEVDKGTYNGELNNMKMMAAGMAHVATTSREAGINTSLPELISSIYNQTVSDGYGQAGLTSIIEVLKKP